MGVCVLHIKRFMFSASRCTCLFAGAAVAAVRCWRAVVVNWRHDVNSISWRPASASSRSLSASRAVTAAQAAAPTHEPTHLMLL